LLVIYEQEVKKQKVSSNPLDALICANHHDCQFKKWEPGAKIPIRYS
jgi:hypothetical protein